MCVLYPLAGPSGKALDAALGSHASNRFKKKDLKALIELHEEEREKSGNPDALTKEEIKMICSTIDLRKATVEDLMIPIKDVKLYF